MTFRREFRAALQLVAKATKTLQDAGLSAPVIVGGSAVEFYTGSAVTSGDFDLVTPHEDVMTEALISLGFRRPRGHGALLRGLVHPELGIGVEFVGGLLMDGKADSSKVRLVGLQEGEIAVTPIEDLIADRLGQAYASLQVREDMLDQAVKLFQLAESLDRNYLERRIRDETGDLVSLVTLEELAGNDHQDHP